MESSTNTTNAPKSNSLFLQIVQHDDGTVTRPGVPLVPAVGPESDPEVLSKDVPLDAAKNTWLRLYLPNTTPPDAKLPVILFLHGGGFVVFSPDTVFYHAFCERIASSLPALVVSLNYRKSPEHRLPAAYDDAVDAVRWLRSASELWVASRGDLSRCFMAGSSSGGNIAYHAAAKLERTVLAGLVMIQPYFGGEQRTKSEAGSEEDAVLPLRASDAMWRMALPEGADRDHEYCNPTARKGVLPRCLVTGCRGDPLFDRQEEFVKMMEREKTAEELVVRFGEGYHAIELFEPASAEKLIGEIREFVNGARQVSFSS